MGFNTVPFVYYIDYKWGQPMDILAKIDALRKLRGWSFYTLALEAGLTQSTVLNMFSRGTQPSIKTLSAICGAFGMTLSEFFDETNAESGLSANEQELILSYRKLNDKEKQAVAALIEKLS